MASLSEDLISTIPDLTTLISEFLNTSMRSLIDLIESYQQTDEMFRWVDDAAATSYVRIDAMVARHRHFIPKEISGLHTKAYTGLSFSHSPSSWNAAGEGKICFVVSRTKLSNTVVDINGQAIFDLTQEMKSLSRDRHWVKTYRDRAVEMSERKPDEAFVIGDIRPLSSVLERIVIFDARPATLARLEAYGELHKVEIAHG